MATTVGRPDFSPKISLIAATAVPSCDMGAAASAPTIGNIQLDCHGGRKESGIIVSFSHHCLRVRV